MAGFTTRALEAGTWPDFARLVDDNDGVWGGCWCMGFHPEGFGPEPRSVERNRANKERRVREGSAHAALVYDGDLCVGWAQFGPPEELPRITSRKAYEKDLDGLPDWRITCFFSGKGDRKAGVADAALAGALGGAQVGRAPSEQARRPFSMGERSPWQPLPQHKRHHAGERRRRTWSRSVVRVMAT